MLRFAVASLVAPLLSGCAYTRIALEDDQREVPARTEGPPLQVVQCVVETHNNGVRFGPATGARTERDVHGVQSALEAAEPRWFSTAPDAQPIIVKIRAEAGHEIMNPSDPGFWLVLPAGATLATIPIYAPLQIRLGVSIQLGPGEWSDARMLSGREDLVVFNPASALLFSWVLREKNGWRRKRDAQGLSSQAESFTPLGYLEGGNGRKVANPHFARSLAEQIVAAWTNLSPPEHRRAMGNPVARKRLESLRPLDPTAVRGGITGVSIPVSTDLPAAVPAPKLVDSGYDPSSRRGFVEFHRNGTEPIAALRWARETAISDLIGKGKNIHILNEGAKDGDRVRIEFETIP